VAAAENGGGLIHGLAVPWNVRGNTSAGPTIINRGAVLVPADRSNVKLLWEHDRTDVHGHAVSFLDMPTGLLATMRVDSTARGAAILAGAGRKMRDGLSVGLDIVDADHDGDLLTVRRAILREISSVGVPAWNDARAIIHNGRN
jgi:HK97 family phage prohead protease